MVFKKTDPTKPRPFGHYFILEKIAQGGMAEIFKGLTYDFSGIKKFIVIKRILPHIAANKEFIDMLVSEAKIAVNLSHGNIAQIFDLGKVNNDYFIVMEYVDGKTLSQIQRKSLEKAILVPLEFCIHVIAEVCNGLDYIHRRKDDSGNELSIVHRDISPQNIITSFSGNVKIVDFGVAKAASKLGEQETGILKGKFAYMSPEQAEGLEIDYRSDLFSLGILFWELLTGQRLFKKKSNAETVEAVKTMHVFPPSHFRPDIPAELDAIVLRALNRNLNERYSNAQEMSQDLTRLLLKYFPEFKALSICDFLNQLFEKEEDVTGDIHFERTQREELTLMDGTQGAHTNSGAKFDSKKKPIEITQVVNPQEIDFESVFGDLSWNDESKSLAKNNPERESKSTAPEPHPADEELSVTNIIEMHLRAEELGGYVRERHRKIRLTIYIFLIFFSLLLIVFIKPAFLSRILEFFRAKF
ncbi:MAG: serine/threonine protein kinase [Deltaproteobacteria bacterium]|nr:serine/threonine protein kinase [Deltaproteobacteria bacterium]